MPVLTYDAGALFVIRVVKHLITNPGNSWANSYECKAEEAGTAGDLLVLGNRLVDFEAALHFTTTLFDRLTISTWEPDSVPYDPTAFISSTLSTIGDIEITSDPLSLNQALSVTRVASSGRFGHIFYRNGVGEEQVQAPAGVTVLNSRSDFQDLLDGAITASSLDDHMGNAPMENVHLVMINANGTQVRNVLGLVVQNMTSIKLDHMWFNRT